MWLLDSLLHKGCVWCSEGLLPTKSQSNLRSDFRDLHSCLTSSSSTLLHPPRPTRDSRPRRQPKRSPERSRLRQRPSLQLKGFRESEFTKLRKKDEEAVLAKQINRLRVAATIQTKRTGNGHSIYYPGNTSWPSVLVPRGSDGLGMKQPRSRAGEWEWGIGIPI